MIICIDYEDNKKITGNKLYSYTKNKLNGRYSDLECNLVSFAYRDVNGMTIGRIVGTIFFHSLHIEMLFVEPEHNGKGIGKALLEAAEKKGRELGCHFAHLETMSFNAPVFYEINGYKMIYKAENSPIKNESHYFYVKVL